MLQKFRIDGEDVPEDNGSIRRYTDWLSHRTMAAIANCPIDIAGEPRRMVYLTDKVNTRFTAPAVCKLFGITVKGYITIALKGYTFHPTKS